MCRLLERGKGDWMNQRNVKDFGTASVSEPCLQKWQTLGGGGSHTALGMTIRTFSITRQIPFIVARVFKGEWGVSILFYDRYGFGGVHLVGKFWFQKFKSA